LVGLNLSMAAVGGVDWKLFAADVITPELCQDLLQNDYVVSDIAFEAVASALRREAQLLYSGGQMREHTFQFGNGSANGNPIIFRKPHIFETDLHDVNLNREEIPLLQSLFDSCALAHVFAEHLPELGLVCHTGGTTIKVQRNEGKGGAFAHHYDNPGPPNKRALTCLLYLNDDWKEGDGGELELQPMFQPPVVVTPTMAKFVVFRSDRVLHRVLPATAMRLCFTVWIDGTSVNGPDEVNLKAKHIALDGMSTEEHANFFKISPLQRVISRAIYADEYESSLRQCMLEPQEVGPAGVRAGQAMLAEHAAHVQALRKNASLAAFIDALCDFKESQSLSSYPHSSSHRER
jgi:hypothetical protein